MGEVYRARDARLGRDVAIKILPHEVAATDELRQRFEREARTISKLNHPGICSIYDVGREGDVQYLVMELIEGETLAARLAKGRLPIDQVLRSGAEIAAALAVAHARGIVHRDLKPANVMLTRSGVKLLDFGLARASEPIDGSLAQTVTQGITVAGEHALIGTIPYMAPEQIEGKPLDARADLFALGAVLHEMITGKRAFAGPNQAAVMGAILHQDPPSATALRPECPATLSSLVRRCLARDPEQRLNSAHDLALQLRELAAGAGDASSPLPAARKRGGAVLWASGAAALAVVIALFAVFKREPPEHGHHGSIRFDVSPTSGRTFFFVFESNCSAVSPDGSRIALILSDPDGSHRLLAVRELGSIEMRSLPGTDGVSSIMWSPDGQSLAFFTGTTLKRVALDGGAPVAICDVTAGGGKSGTWGRRGDILFSSIQGDAIYRVSATGGTPKILLASGSPGSAHRLGWPCYLPDGDHFLYCAGTGKAEGMIRLASHDGASKPLIASVSMAQFTEPDLLVFAREGVLYGQHFDWRAGRLRGGPFAICDSVRYFLSTGSAEFATSAGGTLIYQSSWDINRPYWFDRAGHALGAAAPAGNYLDLELSRDGNTLLFSRTWPGIGTYDLWSLDLARGVESRLTSGRGSEFAPLWMPGGRAVVHAAQTEVLPQIFMHDLESGAEKQVRPSNGFQAPAGVTPDGRTLIYVERTEHAGFIPKSMRLDDTSASVPLLPAGIQAYFASLSPDGHTLAMITDESGAPELYVAPFPGAGPRVRISDHGATLPRWSHDGHELFYIAPSEGLMATTIGTAPSPSVSKPLRLIPAEIASRWLAFDVTPDGRRFLAVVPEVNADLLPLHVIVNWPAAAGAK
jgi:serine/threonine protein kinase